MLHQLLANPPTIRTTMYGVGEFIDSPEFNDYSPWEHANLLNARVIPNMTLPPNMPFAYSPELHVIFHRQGLAPDVEWCGLTHELVHYERRDRGKSRREETRADRIAAMRLVRPSRVALSGIDQGDLPALAREFNVTENIMRVAARLARNGAMPKMSLALEAVA